MSNNEVEIEHHPRTQVSAGKILRALFKARDRDKEVTPQVLGAIFEQFRSELDALNKELDIANRTVATLTETLDEFRNHSYESLEE